MGEGVLDRFVADRADVLRGDGLLDLPVRATEGREIVGERFLVGEGVLDLPEREEVMRPETTGERIDEPRGDTKGEIIGETAIAC